ELVPGVLESPHIAPTHSIGTELRRVGFARLFSRFRWRRILDRVQFSTRRDKIAEMLGWPWDVHDHEQVRRVSASQSSNQDPRTEPFRIFWGRIGEPLDLNGH